MTERKRRKWDVAAPQGIPINSSVVGTGAQPLGSTPGFAGQASQLSAYAPLPAPKPPIAPAKPGQPLDADTIARAQQGAAAIVAKLNQELAAQGKLPQGRGGGARGGATEDPGIFREVRINDAPAELRHHLTKRPTQDDIARRTGTQIVTRGRYLAPGVAPAEGEKPLHLHITPGASAAQDDAEKRRTCDAAAAEVQGILQGRALPRGGPYVPPPRAAFNAVGPPSQAYGLAPAGGQAYAGPVGQPVPGAPGFQCTSLWVGFEAAPDFQLVQRLRGPGDSFLQHIGTETSATVALRGRGSGVQEADPLHMYVAAATPKAFADAARLAQNLIDTVRAEHAKHAPYAPQQQQQHGGPYGAGVPAPGGQGVPPQHMAAAYGYPPPGAAYPPPGAYPHPHAAPGAPGYPMPYMAGAAYPPPYTPVPGYAPSQGYRPPQTAGGPYGQPQPYAAPPQAAGAYPAASAAAGYPPPYHQGYPAPYAQPAPQAQAPAANRASAPPPDRVGLPSPQQQQQQQQQLPGAGQAAQGGQAEGEQRRKRFREFKEDKQAAQEPPPYYAQLTAGAQAQAQAPMGPPPPRQAHAAMGPPPDRRPQPGANNGFQPMGPPPPRQPAQKAAGASAGEAQSVFGGLVEYGDED